jgi:hypothetical protein
MRAGRRLSCLLAACVAVAGWGGGDKERTAAPAAAAGTGGEPPAATASVAPEATVQPLAYGTGAKAGLAGGGIGVVDLANRAVIEPRKMDVNSEQTLAGVRWSGWGNPSATGRGELETLICDPTCATGRLERSTAVIVLSKAQRCGGNRFYTRSTMTYKEPKTGRTRAPDTYLRTPPC